MNEITETALDPRQAPAQQIVLLQSLHAAPQRAARLAASLPPEAHDWQATPEAWSVRMLLAHLANGEAPFLTRMQTIAEADNPYLPYFGPDVARPESTESSAELVERFRRARSKLVQMLIDLEPAQWGRPAVHETMGATTLALQAQNIANHDATHLAQLAAVVRAWEQRPHA